MPGRPPPAGQRDHQRQRVRRSAPEQPAAGAAAGRSKSAAWHRARGGGTAAANAGRRQDTLAKLAQGDGPSLIAQGRWSDAAIAAALFISPKVVENTIASIFGELSLPLPTATTAASSPPSVPESMNGPPQASAPVLPAACQMRSRAR